MVYGDGVVGVGVSVVVDVGVGVLVGVVSVGTLFEVHATAANTATKVTPTITTLKWDKTLSNIFLLRHFTLVYG